jgi:hypothetical protein
VLKHLYAQDAVVRGRGLGSSNGREGVEDQASHMESKHHT